VMCTSLGSTILLWRLMQRSRERLAIIADVDRLRSTLTSMKADAGSDQRVVVSAAFLEKVARIENAQIARERADAVLASVRSVDRGYGLLVAREVSEQKATLAPSQRLAVEELIDRVLADPYLPALAKEQLDGLWRATTPDGASEVDYSVDESMRRIHIVAFRLRGTVPVGH